MMGPTHSMMGLAAGLGTGMALQATGVYAFSDPEILAFAAISAGAGLLPDLDHPDATIARTWGPVSRAIAKGTNKLSAAVVNMTAGPKDRHVKDGHRYLTHTLLWAAFMGVVALMSLVAWGYWAGIVLVYALLSLAIQGLFRKRARAAGPLVSNAVALGAAMGLEAVMPATFQPVILALAVFVGMIAHDFGDAPTIKGIPFWALLLPARDGKRWKDDHLLPEGMRVRASGPANTVCFYLFAIVSAALLYDMLPPTL